MSVAYGDKRHHNKMPHHACASASVCNQCPGASVCNQCPCLCPSMKPTISSEVPTFSNSLPTQFTASSFVKRHFAPFFRAPLSTSAHKSPLELVPPNPKEDTPKHWA